ncbi:MAG: hypothetical protein SAJ12_24485 [Jaaginema sp. PMC 1079.18]|nr:hypothetical protein [Jaaginema sp. PMC 1080.18]MEC4854152.1 hypothetical protein [Jaaginema sp. PMC 1079.18]MEC4865807.1 hypothetical protein [Jaaginema sp. PMC 1078.18]
MLSPEGQLYHENFLDAESREAIARADRYSIRIQGSGTSGGFFRGRWFLGILAARFETAIAQGSLFSEFISSITNIYDFLW